PQDQMRQFYRVHVSGAGEIRDRPLALLRLEVDVIPVAPVGLDGAVLLGVGRTPAAAKPALVGAGHLDDPLIEDPFGQVLDGAVAESPGGLEHGRHLVDVDVEIDVWEALRSAVFPLWLCVGGGVPDGQQAQQSQQQGGRIDHTLSHDTLLWNRWRANVLPDGGYWCGRRASTSPPAATAWPPHRRHCPPVPLPARAHPQGPGAVRRAHCSWGMVRGPLRCFLEALAAFSAILADIRSGE